MWAWLILLVMIGLGWHVAALHHWVPAVPWNGAAAWHALWSPLPSAVPRSSGALQRIPGQPSSLKGVVGPSHHVPIAWGTIGWGVGWGLGGLWVLIGTLAWLYHTPASVRNGQTWRDWMFWRWPMIVLGTLTHQPSWVTEAFHRYHRTWTTAENPPGIDATWSTVAHVLDAGLARSLGDAIWMTGPDGGPVRRIQIVADGDGVHPAWPHGFDAEMMQAWMQWATQWAEIALHHAGVPGSWTVSDEGVVRRGRDPQHGPSPQVISGDLPSPVSRTMRDGLSDTTRWGAQGLTWQDLRSVAPNPLPLLTTPLPTDRVQEVVQVLAHLGFPDVEAIGGQRGLTVDVVKIRPPAALAKRILAESATLAGQLGHGDLPLRMTYVDGEPGVIAVERPRPDRQFVDLVTAFARTDPKDRQKIQRMALPVCCLVQANGIPFWSDAATWPHLLAGGTTGGGKTMTLAGWLASLMMTVPPSQLRITLVDLKAGSSFPWAKQMPHVDALLTTPTEVCTLVAQWVDEADTRFAAFAEGGVEDLRAALAAGWTQYPYRMLVIDEFKDLKDQLDHDKDALKDLERNIGRLGQKARGAGLLLWIITQHPMAVAIGSTLKANLPSRLALKVTSTSASQVILDSPGAEMLLGQGDALFKDSTMGVAVRGQTPFVTSNVWHVIRQGWSPDIAHRDHA